MLAMTHLGGFGVGRFARPEHVLNLGSASNLELLTWVRNSTGWNGIDPCKVTVNVVSGATINASWTGGYALYIRNFPLECELFLNIQGNAWILGCGGAGGLGGNGGDSNTRGSNGYAGAQGGPALFVGSRVTITNSGVIGAGGGGGGGAAGGFRSSGTVDPIGGGGGGGGAGVPAGAAANGGTGYNSWYGRAGTVGNQTAGGAGGAPGYTGVGVGYGGNGGALGSPGSPGAGAVYTRPIYTFYGGDGGATNYAVYGNSNITWLVVGTILGWVA